MANPAPIPPVVLNGHLPVQDIDLSDAQYPRDGVTYQPTNPNIVREPDAVFLQSLTQSINNSAHVSTLGHRVNFVNGTPVGYGLFTVHRPFVHQPRGHRYVFGHPSGGAFRSMSVFSEHVVSIIQNNLDNCSCRLCQPGVWMHSQLEKHRARRAGATTTHLSPVPPAAPAAPTVS
ncbi:unnamed protein product [Aureobasidium pullulans]|uniref:Cryptic loci regulator 2 N-terminal domain-containing protein n=1 Tax=Aureobasidium pullulans TaxID=5580 RepID=A0A4S8YIV1_AURPU|nr:hypothetical protein D6D22_00713 [Aureobasidium pullulans]CAC9893919.1 unnamed protein product [Aureobasidium pullulans]